MQQIPPPYKDNFQNGIRHPLLYLWDAWSYVAEGVMHLYCLAVSRQKPDGTPLQPIERNNFPFHIRHFTSANEGKTWQDEGAFLTTQAWSASTNFYTVWSGSIEALPNGKKLTAFTALERPDAEHIFLQNIMLAISADGYTIDKLSPEVLSSPRRDWEAITQLGYYLDEPPNLGNQAGEGGGPILAWRDPFIFLDQEGKVHLFWGGKISPTKSALVRAELKADGDFYKIKELIPPVTVPDGNEFTQLELPKVLYDKKRDWYYLMISTCNRLYEGQADEEVDKAVRLYKSKSMDGPWESLGQKILTTENLFGPTVLMTDFQNNRLLCIAPYTDAAEEHLRLSFSPIFWVHLDTLEVELNAYT